ASSISWVYSVISPPTIERSPAMMLPPSPRLRTTTPKHWPLTNTLALDLGYPVMGDILGSDDQQLRSPQGSPRHSLAAKSLTCDERGAITIAGRIDGGRRCSGPVARWLRGAIRRSTGCCPGRCRTR